MHDATFPPHGAPGSHLDHLVRKVQAGDSSSIDELNRLLTPGVRFFIERALDDRYVDQAARAVLSEITQAIREGALRDSRQLLGEVRRAVQSHLDSEQASHCRLERDPMATRQAALLARAMPDAEREVVKRFYLLGQSEGQIMAEMHLSPEQVRTLKLAARRRVPQQHTCPAA